MTFQNRIALDMLLAETGSVCVIFGDTCCTFIPNNTASDGSLTKAIDGLRTFNKRLKKQSGVDRSMWNDLDGCIWEIQIHCLLCADLYSRLCSRFNIVLLLHTLY
ncbi:hypothetical protein NL108_014434 [Boleophthalmus pectinirostris]|nr:hypothetical protein NL108_014434 [Boleophthalmus pectinirostris]